MGAVRGVAGWWNHLVHATPHPAATHNNTVCGPMLPCTTLVRAPPANRSHPCVVGDAEGALAAQPLGQPVAAHVARPQRLALGTAQTCGHGDDES